MPCNSTAQAEDELVEILTYDPLRSAFKFFLGVRSNSSDLEFDLNNHVLQNLFITVVCMVAVRPAKGD
jgi:hypothetical protein